MFVFRFAPQLIMMVFNMVYAPNSSSAKGYEENGYIMLKFWV